MTAEYRTRQGDLIDRICWHHYGRQSGAVEAVLGANPGLAALGPALPAGQVIVLPDLPAAQTDAVVNIWD